MVIALLLGAAACAPGATATNQTPVIWDYDFGTALLSRGGAYNMRVVVQPDEKPIIVHSLGGVSRVVRLNSDGSIDSTFAPAVLDVSELSEPNVVLDSAGRCLVSGNFRSVNGKPRPRLARLLSNGDLDDTFHFLPVGP